MKLRKTPVLASIAAALLLCSASPSAAATYVSGRLLTRDMQQPIPGATISLLPPSDAPASFGHSAADTPALAIAQTLANGSFVLSAPGAGSYRILVHKAEYPELEQSLIVPEAGLSGLVLSIVPPPTAHILVLDPAGKPVTKGAAVVWMLVAPLSGVTVSGKWVRKPVSPTGMLDVMAPVGARVRRQAARVEIGIRFGPVGWGRVTLPGWPADLVRIRLQPGVTLSGKVTDREGKPVPGVRLVVGSLDKDWEERFTCGWAFITADRQGNFALHSLPAGRWSVQGFPTGAGCPFKIATIAGKDLTLTLGAGEAMPGPVRMAPFGASNDWDGQASLDLPTAHPKEGTYWATISGRAIDPATNEAPPAAVVVIRRPQESEPLDVIEPRAGGIYVFHVPCPGMYTVQAEAPGCVFASRTAEAPAYGRASLDLVLSRQPLIPVSIDFGGAPLSGKPVQWALSVRRGQRNYLQGGSASPDAKGRLDLPAPAAIAASDEGNVAEVSVMVRIPGSGCGEATIAGWPKEPIPVTLQPGAILRGQLESKRPALKVTVTRMVSMFSQSPAPYGRNPETPDFWTQAETHTDSRGAFQVPDLLPGARYEVQVDWPGIQPEEVQIGSGVNEIRLRAAGTERRRLP